MFLVRQANRRDDAPCLPLGPCSSLSHGRPCRLLHLATHILWPTTRYATQAALRAIISLGRPRVLARLRAPRTPLISIAGELRLFPKPWLSSAYAASSIRKRTTCGAGGAGPGRAGASRNDRAGRHGCGGRCRRGRLGARWRPTLLGSRLRPGPDGRQLRAHGALGHLGVVSGLGAQPVAVGQPEEAAQPQIRICTDARLPATISPMRCAGTPISFARRYWLMPIGFRNSSSRSSPGVTGLSLRMLPLPQR